MSVNTSAGAAMAFEAYSMIASKKVDLANKPIFDKPNAFIALSVCLPFDAPAIGAAAIPARGAIARRQVPAPAAGRPRY